MEIPSREELLARVPDKPYLTTKEVQEIFEVHEITVYRWVAAGKLVAHRVAARGKANVYKRDDVVAFVDARYTIRPIRDKSEHGESSEQDGASGPKRRKRRRRVKKKARRTKKKEA